MGLNDEIENKYFFYKKGQEQKLEIKRIKTKVEMLKQKRISLQFLGEEREKKKKYERPTSNKSLHLCRHVLRHQEKDVATHPMI